MSFFEKFKDSVVSFAQDSAKIVEKEVVNPTVSFANDSAKFVEKEIVNPTVSFTNDSTKFVEKQMIDPIASFFKRPHDVLEQQQILDNLEQSNGSDFPGGDYHPPDRKNWMDDLTVEKLAINKIVWPGTHNSATNGIGINLVTHPLAECQTLSIYDQLVLGTRLLDIRVQEDRRTCHGIVTSYSVNVVLSDVLTFLSETRSEIVILEIRTEYGHKDPPEFEAYLVDKLGQFLIPQDDDLFSKKVSEVLPKRIICIWKPKESPKPRRGGLLWNSDYLKDNWINTDLPWIKFQSNLKNLNEQKPIYSRRLFYRVENTLTPQVDNPVFWVKPVTDRIRKHARLFISQCISKGCLDKLQILSTDFIEEDFVDACVGLTRARIQGIA